VGVLDPFKKVAHAYEQYNDKTQTWAVVFLKYHKKIGLGVNKSCFRLVFI